MEQQQDQQQQEMKDQLKELLDEYFGDCESRDIYRDNHSRNRLVEFLRNNDCRAILPTVGDSFTELFLNASCCNHLDLVQACVENGINVDAQNAIGWTAFMYACSRSDTDIALYLLEHHANSDIQDCGGQTALINASQHSNLNIVRLLLDHNADIDLRDKQGETALDLAKNEEIKEMLSNHVTGSYLLK